MPNQVKLTDTKLRQEALQLVQRGDIVTRWLAGSIPMDLRVAEVTDDLIMCGWEFDRKTGAEIDEDLGWGPPPKMTGSYITVKEIKTHVQT